MRRQKAVDARRGPVPASGPASAPRIAPNGIEEL